MEAVTSVTGGEQAGAVVSLAVEDEARMRDLIAQHHDDMRRVCRYITRDEAITDEAVQAAWAIAWRKLDRVRDPDRIKPWLVSIAVNEAKQLLRKRRRRSELEMVSEETLVHWPARPDADAEAIDLRRAIERLDAGDQALLAMRYVAGFDATELSIAIGISPAGVRTRLKRLLDRLRKELADG